ncbi:unnamed protein product [Arabidopsis thaliana]|uniref:Uncharacterized protein n=1 Tax=Arabidopsis thaliana TaxID=3702 RepID=A0A654EUB0_ARATH|nr:unnamed protein product [Arabidopsis thaliana]
MKRDEPSVTTTKRRRLSGSEERQAKKAKTGSGEKMSHSPSVFERFSNSGDKGNSGERFKSKGSQGSVE